MIAFDLQAVQSRSHAERGIARYCLELALAIERRAPGRVDRFLINPNRPVPAILEPLLRTGRVIRSDMLGRAPIELLHLGSPVELDVPVEQLLVGRPARMVANLYDLIPLVFAKHYLRDAELMARYRARLGLYQSADWILSDSNSAIEDGVRLLGLPRERCIRLGAGTSPMFRPADDGEASFEQARAAVPDLRRRFIMLPSGIDWRKNIAGVIDAYGALDPRLRRRHQLVIVCRLLPSERAELERAAANAGCAESVVLTGFVTDRVLVALYQSAELVVFPSRYEGFGLPVLEARRCGTPVICGDNSSLREVQPDPAARFDVDDAESIRMTLQRALEDPAHLDALRSAPIPDFTWDRAAEATLEIYDRALARAAPQALRGDHRPRVAYVTPLPPVPSGVATYSSRLLTSLARIARVRCFTDQDLERTLVPPGVAVSPLADLHPMYLAGEFDHVVYALGNNVAHREALAELRRTPGAVHLHDARLVGCYADEPWPWIVERHYPGRFTSYELEQLVSPWSPLVTSRTVLLLAEVAQHAEMILTNSAHAAHLVELDTGRADVYDIGPHAVRRLEVRPDVRRELVGTFGIVSEVKQCDKVAAAFAAARVRRSTLEAVFVGEAPPGFDGRGATVTGHVTDVEFEQWLEHTAVAVQLRATSNGESSGAVAECLAAAVPTIVTDLGAAVEIPDDVVVKVPVDVTAEELTSILLELIDDHDRRRSLARAAARYAAANTFDVAAGRLLDALERTALTRRSIPAAG